MNPHIMVTFLIGLVLIALNVMFLGETRITHPENSIEYKDLISIILTAVTVVLAALAIGIAILAVWGYRELITNINRRMETLAQDQIRAYIQGEDFRAMAEAAMAEERR